VKSAILNIVNKTLSYTMYPFVVAALRNATYDHCKGGTIKPFSKDCSSVDMEIISISLSRTKRFFGQTKFSVAQHCVNMARVFLVLKKEEFAKQALLHECSEAFLGDLVPFVKKELYIFKLLERVINKKVFLCLNVPYPVSQEVDKLDKTIVFNEAICNMSKHSHWQSKKRADDTLLAKAGVDLEPWSEEKAQEEFMTLYVKLFK
jgi:5'-deoxynucleotidase YfbR-like HD superfamily hydrolase